MTHVAARLGAVRQVAALATLVVIVGAVVGVAGLRTQADRGRQAELLLVRLEGLT